MERKCRRILPVFFAETEVVERESCIVRVAEAIHATAGAWILSCGKMRGWISLGSGSRTLTAIPSFDQSSVRLKISGASRAATPNINNNIIRQRWSLSRLTSGKSSRFVPARTHRRHTLAHLSIAGQVAVIPRSGRKACRRAIRRKPAASIASGFCSAESVPLSCAKTPRKW